MRDAFTIWRHVATDSLYLFLGDATCSTNGERDGKEKSVVYFSLKYQRWFYREAAEFFDGRFERVEPPVWPGKRPSAPPAEAALEEDPFFLPVEGPEDGPLPDIAAAAERRTLERVAEVLRDRREFIRADEARLVEARSFKTANALRHDREALEAATRLLAAAFPGTWPEGGR